MIDTAIIAIAVIACVGLFFGWLLPEKKEAPTQKKAPTHYPGEFYSETTTETQGGEENGN